MQCPRCGSLRVQRGYKDATFIFRIIGLHELLCNNCGLEFKRFKLSGTPERAPSTKTELPKNRRRAPRYQAHLPATISLVGTNSRTGKSHQSEPARGTCVAISEFGLAVSFVGARFEADEFDSTGRLLMVRVFLPKSPIDVLVTTVMHERIVEEGGQAKWLVGTSIANISEADREQLTNYLKTRAQGGLLFSEE